MFLTLYGSTGSRDSPLTKMIRLPKIEGDPHAEKRAEAVRLLGTRCVLHPFRRIQKGTYETTILRANVAETIRRARKRLEREAKAKPKNGGAT